MRSMERKYLGEMKTGSRKDIFSQDKCTSKIRSD
jgi:hypothetical protein